MELEDKIKQLEEQFKGLPKVLIKRTLCGDDINEDLTKAMDRLREFQQMKTSLSHNPTATPVTEELRGSLNVTPAEELDRNAVVKNCIIEGTETVRCHRTGDRKATHPPKPKPKPNWRKSHGHDKDCRETQDSKLPFYAPSATGLPTRPRTGPPRPHAQSSSLLPPANRHAQSTTLPPRTYRLSTSQPPLPHSVPTAPPPPPLLYEQSAPPPPRSHRWSTPEPPLRDEQSAPPARPSHRWSTPEPPLRDEQSAPPARPSHRWPSPEPPLPNDQSAPPPPPSHRWSSPGQPVLYEQSAAPPHPAHRWSSLGQPLLCEQSAPLRPPLDRRSTPEPPPVLAEHTLCVHGKVTGNKAGKDNDAALEILKAANNNVQEGQMELEEKIKMLKEEFSSLPRVLIKKTLCDDGVDGDVTIAKQRLMEFKPQLKGREHCFKNAGEAGRNTDKLNRNSNDSPVFRHTKMESIHLEEQALPGRENQLPSNWLPMPRDDWGKDIDVHLVKLASTSVEYQDVVERLQQTVNSNPMIKSVERIQNPYLYQAYQLRKQKMDRDNPQANNERPLFHGTNSDNVKKINRQGFDRSFSGSVHGAVYGAGVYFARDASYSMCYTGGSHQVMYLARVLVGRYCKGSPSMKKPPAINSEQPEILFDSMVDNINDPSIFVVYHDNQSYPEYLITI